MRFTVFVLMVGGLAAVLPPVQAQTRPVVASAVARGRSPLEVTVHGPFARVAGQRYVVDVVKEREERSPDGAVRRSEARATARVHVAAVTARTYTVEWVYDAVAPASEGADGLEPRQAAALLGVVDNLRLLYQGSDRAAPQGLLNRREVQAAYRAVLPPVAGRAVAQPVAADLADLRATLQTVSDLLAFSLAEPALLHALDGQHLTAEATQRLETTRPGPFDDAPIPGFFLLTLRPHATEAHLATVTRATRLDRSVLADQALALVGGGTPETVDPALAAQVRASLEVAETAEFDLDRATGAIRAVRYDKRLRVGASTRTERIALTVRPE